MGIYERKLCCGHRFRQGRPPPPENGDRDPLYASPRAWLLMIPGARAGRPRCVLRQGLGTRETATRSRDRRVEKA